MKKNIFLVVCIIAVCFSVILLYQSLYLKQDKNGFKRKIVKTTYKLEHSIKLPSSFCYFAGEPKGELYLKDLQTANAILIVDFILSGIKKQVFEVPDEISFRKKKVNIGVNDTSVFISGNLAGNLNIYSLTDHTRQSYKNPKIWFDQTTVASNTTVIGRGLKTIEGNLQIQLINFNYKKSNIKTVYNLSEKAANVFNLDGQLQLSKTSKDLFYMFFYQGSFLCLDTNLNLKYKAKTIDTITSSSLKTATLTNNKTETKITPSSPRNVINRGYTLYQNNLYLISSLKADNESFSSFRDNQVIDVYSCESGKYLYSFYVPKFKREKLRELKIHYNTLYAIYDNFLVGYKLIQ
jgi:hypothetical protein